MRAEELEDASCLDGPRAFGMQAKLIDRKSGQMLEEVFR